MNTRNIFLISTLILFSFHSCQKEPDFTNFNYETYNRVVGPDGGRVDFYGNYADDNENNILVSLEVPQGALDSMMVFNMYQFEDYELVLQMENGYAEIGSKFLYFVPFYESDGYHERGQLDLSYHLSLDFNSPVSVTYNFLADGGGLSAETWQEAELYHDHYKKTNRSYRLYRIKIPKLDEWGEGDNIFVNWNNQGYPDGYDRTDLYYIISGIWSSVNEWGKGYLSLENWEPVNDFNIDTDNSSVSFEISNTDYMYVVCRIIYLKSEDVPIKISNTLTKLYPTLSIERGSFSNNKFTLFLSDDSYATFTKNGEFEYLTNANLSRSDLPMDAVSFIDVNYPDDATKKVTLKETVAWQNYEVLLRSGIKLFFNGLGELTGTYQFGIDHQDLPAAALTHIQENHPGNLITNVTFNKEDLSAPRYIVYLSSDAKVYFDIDGYWLSTLYFRFDENELPDAITEFIENNINNPTYSEINYTILNGEGAFYDVYLVDSRMLRFDEDGRLSEMEFENMEESALPDDISNYIGNHFPNMEVTKVSYYYYDYGNDESFDIYFSDGLNVEFDRTGTVYALYGNRLNHLPVPVRQHVQTNYTNSNMLYCSYESEGEITTLGLNEDVSHYWDLYFAGDLWVGLNQDLNPAYSSKENAVLSDLHTSIASYVATNHPGQPINELSNYFSPSYGEIIYYLGLGDGTELVFDINGLFLDQLKRATKVRFNKSKSMKKRLILK